MYVDSDMSFIRKLKLDNYQINLNKQRIIMISIRNELIYYLKKIRKSQILEELMN